METEMPWYGTGSPAQLQDQTQVQRTTPHPETCHETLEPLGLSHSKGIFFYDLRILATGENQA